MARWPRHVWTSLVTYGIVFVVFPLLCLLAYLWVRGPTMEFLEEEPATVKGTTE